MTTDDEPDFTHIRLEAESPASLQSQIATQQQDGFELISVVREEESTWHAFMKRNPVNWPVAHATALDEINTGIGMILDNHQGLVTSGHLSDLQAVVHCILTVLEKKHPS
jgi:hypothetical protein